ncbi:MAG: membrane dipeptidase [Candidatus Niameybacter stercoravium]|nr:membrane dipeptidase [Candidatus Niameybacter stercoravium]
MSFIDLHCDTASLIFENKAHLNRNDYHVDIEKMKASHYLAQWFAFFIDIKGLKNTDPFTYLKEMYAYFKAEVEANSDTICIVSTYKDYLKCKAENKIAAFLSLEEGEAIAGLDDPLEKLMELGITMMTLTWNHMNTWGYPHSILKGLTPKGCELLEGLNHTPILLDVSHLSESAFKDITRLYKKPIIASHCNARNYYDHTRNLSDEAMKVIAESGGIIGTNFYSYFLNNSNHTSIEDLLRNMQYVYNQVGEEALAIGSDFDGMSCNLEVCNCGEMDKLMGSMTRIFPMRIIEKICYSNAERIIRENL